jgi:hypothetical protein
MPTGNEDKYTTNIDIPHFGSAWLSSKHVETAFPWPCSHFGAKHVIGLHQVGTAVAALRIVCKGRL